MERSEIEQKIRTILVDELEIEEALITPDAQLKADIGIDSLDLVDVVVYIDKAFSVKIVPAQLSTIKTYKQLVDFLYEKVNG